MASTRKVILDRLLIALLAAYTLLWFAFECSRLWSPSGDFGYVLDTERTITQIRRGSSAEKAQLKVGDTLTISDIARPLRYKAFFDFGRIGDREKIVVNRGQQPSELTLVAGPELRSTSSILRLALRLLAGLCFIAIGAALVWLRPNVMTWGFYLFCISANPAPSSVLPATLPYPWDVAFGIVTDVLGAAGMVGVLIFTLGFPNDTYAGWRGAIRQLSPYIVIVLGALWVGSDLLSYWFGVSAAPTNIALLTSIIAIVGLAMFALIQTYFVSTAQDKQRIRWVVAGFAFAAVLGLIPFGQALVGSTQLETGLVSSTFLLTPVVVPLTVAYAVLHHRVIDIRFAISRAIVYGLLTSILVALFAVIDWLFVRKLVTTDLGIAVELAVAVAIGFWLNTLHHRVDSFVDRTFFRRRYQAEERLELVAHALPHSPTEETVNQSLTVEPKSALELGSAALFREERGSYIRVSGVGWSSATTFHLPASDKLVLHMQAEQAPLRIALLHWEKLDIPTGDATPALAVPILARRQLRAIVLYGKHLSGADFDQDEIRLLEKIAIAAGATYDHIEAEALQLENKKLREQLHTSGTPMRAFE